MYNAVTIEVDGEKKMRAFLNALCLCLLIPTGQATTFILDKDSTRVIGHNLIVYSRSQDTLLDIARRFDIGYSEIVSANPDLDVWLPGSGKRVLVPNQYILPDASQKGIVINLAEMRLYYYPKPEEGKPRRVITHPIGIGREGWQTPLGNTRIIQKRKDPTWTPPASIHAEHLEKGDPLPNVVPAGPDNPLGAYAMRLGMPGYLLHGTNKPYGVGLRVSHGCIRLFPEDIEHLFGVVALNTSVEIVYQPYKASMLNGDLYVESHEAYEDMPLDHNNMTPMVKAILDAKGELSDDDWLFAQAMIDQNLGIAQRIGEITHQVIEDVWFIHSGLTTKDISDELDQAAIEMGFSDAFWPIRGAEGEVLIGPFESYQQAETVADKIYNTTGESAWVTLVPGDVL
ncbi:MAG: L,D-transpeptidase ErfK/SrfK [Methylophagaceae bacterium]|jgi:L,D-transpeptidase ErfK/SrfK